MSKLYKENGLLSESELRTFGGALQKIVGDLISDRVQFNKQVDKKLLEMRDTLGSLTDLER